MNWYYLIAFVSGVISCWGVLRLNGQFDVPCITITKDFSGKLISVCNTGVASYFHVAVPVMTEAVPGLKYKCADCKDTGEVRDDDGNVHSCPICRPVINCNTCVFVNSDGTGNGECRRHAPVAFEKHPITGNISRHGYPDPVGPCGDYVYKRKAAE